MRLDCQTDESTEVGALPFTQPLVWLTALVAGGIVTLPSMQVIPKEHSSQI